MKDTPRRDGIVVSLPVAAGKQIEEGAIAALTAAGFLVDATDEDAAQIVGRANEEAINLDGTAGDLRIDVQRKNAFLFGNSTGADEVKVVHLFSNCYLVDAYTVAGVAGDPARLVAGKVIEISQEGVWVEIA